MTSADTEFLYKLANELESYYVDSGGLGMGGTELNNYPFRGQAQKLREFVDKEPLEKQPSISFQEYHAKRIADATSQKEDRGGPMDFV